ncbi:MAG TPA: aminopeptidase, partial [Sphingomicrobium sp.]|nr:aminopeptidase [Sphingomicrobium sp.]
MSFVRTVVAAAALLLAGCQSSETNTAANAGENQAEATIAPILDTPEAKDDASYARPLEARVYHVALDLNVDFDAKRIGGTAT